MGKNTNRNWAFIATLERDFRQKFWHTFHVPDDTKQKILKHFRDGRDFLFVVEKTSGVPTTVSIQFPYMQTEPPTGLKTQFYKSAGWFTHWRDNVERNPEKEGFIMNMDPGESGDVFENRVNREKEWVLGDIEFRVTGNEALLFSETFEPHIKDGYVLKIYVR